MKLSEIFDSTKGKGISKKIIVFFITGTLMPLLHLIGLPDFIVQALGQLGVFYIGGQSVVDAAHNFRKEKPTP